MLVLSPCCDACVCLLSVSPFPPFPSPQFYAPPPLPPPTRRTLSNNNLKGSIPNSISKLTQLTFLYEAPRFSLVAPPPPPPPPLPPPPRTPHHPHLPQPHPPCPHPLHSLLEAPLLEPLPFQ
ncbi:unnamed protein product [Closterium sp. NIES-53]